MSKFASIIKGTANVLRVDLQLPNIAESIAVHVRPLNAWEDAQVLEKARAFAVERGLAKPTDVDDLYVLGVWANTLLIACQDESGEAFFASADEILKGLDRDRISYLYEQQQRAQEDAGFRKDRMTPGEMLAAIHELATKEVGDATLPFWQWGPSLRASFMRFMAVQLLSLASSKSPSGLTSETANTTSETSANPE